MNEWKRIISDRKRLAVFLFLPFLCLALFFYQKCDGDFSTLLKDSKEYRELLKEHSQNTPAQIVDEFSENWSLTDEEQRLLTQTKHLLSYEEYLERVQEQAHKMQASRIRKNPGFRRSRDGKLSVLDLLLTVLQGVQVVVAAMEGEQLLVVALLDNLSVA